MKTTLKTLIFASSALLTVYFGAVVYYVINPPKPLTVDDAEIGAVVYVPASYDPAKPVKILYWLHGRNQTAWSCSPILETPNFIIVSPHLNPDAMWDQFDLKSLIKQVEDKYPVSERYLEGYSRGANGAIFHAAANPGMFAHVNALAGSYVEKQRVSDPLTIIGGTRDVRHGASSQAYADTVGGSVVWVNSTHNPTEFYGQIEDRVDTPVL